MMKRYAWTLLWVMGFLGNFVCPGQVTAQGRLATKFINLTCKRISVPVGLIDGDAKSYSISGQLCFRGPQPPSVVQLLVHGATYNHLYWNFPYEQPLYSYVNTATLAGYATFDIDRLGAGASSHPLSTLLTVQTDAVALHDVVQALRAGIGEMPGFHRVLFVGHSFGCFGAWAEVSKYHDVDGVVISSALHKVSPSYVVQITAALYPGALDPDFFGRTLDLGYLTSEPGTKCAVLLRPCRGSCRGRDRRSE